MTTRPDATNADSPRAPSDIQKSGWLSILRRSMRQFKHDDVLDRAAALTYFGVLALFPGLLVLVSILGLMGHSTMQKVLDNLHQVAPGGVNKFLRTVIEQVQGRAGAASIGAIVGIVIGLWSASAYVAAFMRATNSIYEVDEGRPLWRTVPLRVGVTLIVVVMLVVCAVMVVVTGPVASQIGRAVGIGDVKQPGFKWIAPGGLIAVIAWLVASALFAVYVAFAGSYNKTYGALATIVIFLVWLWITNIAILLGVEFNAESERQRAHASRHARECRAIRRTARHPEAGRGPTPSSRSDGKHPPTDDARVSETERALVCPAARWATHAR